MLCVVQKLFLVCYNFLFFSSFSLDLCVYIIRQNNNNKTELELKTTFWLDRYTIKITKHTYTIDRLLLRVAYCSRKKRSKSKPETNIQCFIWILSFVLIGGNLVLIFDFFFLFINHPPYDWFFQSINQPNTSSTNRFFSLLIWLIRNNNFRLFGFVRFLNDNLIVYSAIFFFQSYGVSN